MGYYQGQGRPDGMAFGELPGWSKPSCPVAPGINMVQCSWSASLCVTVTARWVPGEYLLKLVGSGGQQSYVPLTVWDPASRAAYVIMDGVAHRPGLQPVRRL